MTDKLNIYSQGKMRVVNFPSIGAYDIATGMGVSPGTYSKSSWAYTCMGMRATALQQMPWRLVNGSGKVIESHPVIDLLSEFGLETNWADAIGATEKDMLLMGAGYWLHDGNRLARLNPNTMKVKRGTGGILGFVQTINSKEQTFERDEVVYFREFHPTDDLGPGVAPADVAKQAILVEYEAQRYIKEFFENDALPGLAVHTEQAMSEAEMNKVKRWWLSKFQGRGKRHQPAFMDKGLKVETLTSDLEKMALKEVRDQARRDICTAFRVPMVIVGDLDAANFATAHEARLTFIVETMIPRSMYYASVINSELVQMIDPNVVFEFATDELDILQEDADAKAARLTSLLWAKVVSPEFVRQEMGYPETAAPDETAPTPPPPDRGAWERKALKALKAGKNADVEFVTDQFPLSMQAAIKAQLSLAQSGSDVRAAFKAAYP